MAPSCRTHVDIVLRRLQANNVTLWDIISVIRSSENELHETVRESLEKNSAHLLSWLLGAPQTRESTMVRVFETVTKVLCKEMLELSLAESGLHFGVSTATAAQLEDSFMLRDLEDPETGEREQDLSEIGGDGVELVEVEGESERPRKRQRKAGERNTAVTLIVSRLVFCVCVMAQNTNGRCNLLQSFLGIFSHSTGTPARVIDVLSHAGLSISASSIDNAVNSLSKESMCAIKKSVQTLQTVFAYDNFDIDFKTAHPTVEHQSTFVSSTSATTIPLYGVTDPADLRCSEQIHQQLLDSHVAASILTGKFTLKDLRIFHKEDTYGKKTDGQRLSPRANNFAWHVRDILIHHGGHHFEFLKADHGQPEPIEVIPLHKTTQTPCRAM
ncbi:hypothetical protein PAXINDRAFT_87714 [Paxillus involutus ATCC 200175]|uniref:Uncharacterized protein n=1 Tax=Paxillus involutus ATCC 200175 TaxID=664439 RepID=A0A0C9T0Q3_PAXIN|nr:hypothetical protein PAXINDRAFT_87714 [Paxillus involutus ATCC 200175]